MTYAQHTRPYERIPERQSSWGGGLPAGVNPPTASPSINTCLMHTDRSDGMPTTKEALTSACCSQHRIICCCLRCFFALEMLELLRAVRPDRLSSATRQCGLSAASSAQRPPARKPRHPISGDRARPIGREVLRPHEVLSEPRRPFLVPQRVNSGSHTVPYTWGCSGRPFFFQRAREAEGGAAPRASLYPKGLTADILAIPGEVACEPHCIEEKAMPADQPKTGGKQLGG